MPAEVGAEPAELAARLDLARLAADLQLAAQPHRAVLVDLQLAGREPQLRVTRRVEELGGEEVALELLLVDLDAGDVDRALQPRASPPLSRAS